MASIALLRIRPESDTCWRVALSLPSGRTVDGVAMNGAIAEVRAAVDALRNVRPAVVPVAGLDTNWRRAEEGVGRALVRLVGSSEDLAHHYPQLFARPDLVVLGVDAEGEVAALPWELVAWGPDGVAVEATHRGAVLRVGRGIDVPFELAPEGLEVVVWCPTPEDEVCGRVMARLDASLEELGQAGARRIDPTREDPHTRVGDALVLHVVCHGIREADAVALMLGGSRTGADAAAARLGRWLSMAAVVILDVCNAGAEVGDVLESLPGRLLACGARACVAPAGEVGTGAAGAFAHGFYRSWLRGQTLAEAVARGRREVAALGMALADSRWHNFRLTVADVRNAAVTGPRADQWRPSGWPRPDRGAQEFLTAAFSVADADGHGFVGLEHFTQALVTGNWRGAFVVRARMGLDRVMAEILGTRRGLSRSPAGEPDMGGTPRLQRLGASLAPGFTLDELWRAIAADGTTLFLELALLPRVTDTPIDFDPTTTGSRPDVLTLTPDTPFPGTGLGGLADGLVVVGGPEDGLELWPEPGDHVGRAGKDPAEVRWQLYRSTAFQDKYLHRDHLVWVGPGRLHVRDPYKVYVHGRAQECPAGEVPVRVGQLILLTAATRLRGIARR